MAGGSAQELLHGLPPILDAEVSTLILGSFPSPASLAAQRYYGHRQNQFWRLLGAVLDEPLPELAYADRQRCLLRHRIGVWDVYRRCRRQGALDSAIQTPELNDFRRLLDDAPRLRRVCFNGQTAARALPWFQQQGLETCLLPSSSPAYTLAFASKLERWRAALAAASAGG
ncbi:DNA-deoxyinosine glycosylase [Accumulibacter sp.]|uniref:DNA-deoxyinosine glycosylase n=1 Tax=Accumulibacter sp. TaxID=2053492 RepID=UPI0026293221|nr:DNA-deoxyinosine glycosylase [Accumulibacter sp.]